MVETLQSSCSDSELIEIVRQLRLIIFDFDGVFTDNTVYVSQDGIESVRCSRADGFGLQKLREIDLEHIVISTETNPVVATRCQKLNVNCIQGCRNKLSELQRLAEEQNISLHNVAFVGNDINDLDCLTHVGLPVVVADAHPDVVYYGKFQTKRSGGLGAVREFCDFIYRIRV